MGSLAAVGMVNGKPFNPDARMKMMLTDAAAIGTATAQTLNWRSPRRLTSSTTIPARPG